MTDKKWISYDRDDAIKGELELFYEQGMSHILWAVYDDKFKGADGARSYDGLCVLERGDLLTVFNDEARTDILWQGKIDFVRETQLGAGMQQNIIRKEWIDMFADERPAELVRAKDVQEQAAVDAPDLEEKQQQKKQQQAHLRNYLRRR